MQWPSLNKQHREVIKLLLEQDLGAAAASDAADAKVASIIE